MTDRDDIIRMAREAGLMPLLDEDCFQTLGVKNFERTKRVLERFFHLAAAAGAVAEREACAKVCEDEAEKWEGDDGPISTEARLCAINIRARGHA